MPQHTDAPHHPPVDNPQLVTAREILRHWSDSRFETWWNSTSGFLNGRRPREVITTEPEMVVAAAQDALGQVATAFWKELLAALENASRRRA